MRKPFISSIKSAIMLFTVLLLFSNHARATTNSIRMQGHILQKYARAVEAYSDDKGIYPLSDENGTWYEKLVEGEYLPAGLPQYGLTPDGSLPLGRYGFPVIYEPPNNSNANTVIFRFVGVNGVDDQGALDDWDIRYGPNVGYWYKSQWPAMYRRSALCGMIAFFGSIITIFVGGNRHRALTYCLLIIGLCGSVLMPYGFGKGIIFINALNTPGWFATVSVVTGWMLIAALLMSLEPCLALIRKRLAKPQLVCISCGYDLNGLPTTICPECGTDQKMSTGQVP